MERREAARRLIVNADDFGRSHSINEAVVRAHREGILTSASLMVNGPEFEEAVALAKENPRLGVGLHLVLVRGRATSPSAEVPGLVDGEGRFHDGPAHAGIRYFFQKSLRGPLKTEITAQFAKFSATGLKLDHVNGHLHFHMHPVVLNILTDPALHLGVTHLRLTREPLWMDARRDRGRWLYRVSHAVIFQLLAARARATLRRRNIRHTGAVFGLLQNGRVDENYVCDLVSELPPGDSELYSHPSLDEFRHEFDALVSPNVRAALDARGIKLIRYQDL